MRRSRFTRVCRRPSSGRLTATRMVCAMAGAVMLLALPAAAQATTWQVNTTNYPGAETCTPSECSLRAAVEAANAGSGGDLVAVPPGTYKLNGFQLAISKGMQIIGTAGAGETTINAHAASGIFSILSSAGPVSISGLTLENGVVPGGGGAVADAAPQQLNLSGDIIGQNTSGGIKGGGAVLVNAAGEASLTVTDSSFLSNAAGGNGGSAFASGMGQGGAIAFLPPSGTLRVTGSFFQGNTAGGNGGMGESSGQGAGGAIYLTHGANGVIAYSSFADNRAGGNGAAGEGSGAGFGGAVDFEPEVESALFIINGSVFQNNETRGGYGGAVSIGSSNRMLSLTSTQAALVNDTLTENNANDGLGGGLSADLATRLIDDTLNGNASSGAGGGNLFFGLNIALKNTIIAGGFAPSGSNCLGGGLIVSEGGNLEDTTPSQCGLTAPSDLIGVNPLLGPLQNHGGPTETEALLPGSPAIDADDDSGCPETDQRGVLRPAGAACDIGAYEVATPTAVTEAASGLSGSSATLNGSFTNPDLAPGTVAFQYGTTTAYGLQTRAQAIEATTVDAPFSAALIGLSLGTTYHFRAVIANGLETVYGADRTFKLSSTAATATAAVAPQLSSLAITPSKIHPYLSRGASLARKHPAKGATISYRDSEVATATLIVQRAASGYRSGAKCLSRRPRRHRGTLRRCTLFVKVGSFTHADTAGLNQLHFTARINGRPLRAGRYRLQAIATNGSGQASTPLIAGFSVVG